MARGRGGTRAGAPGSPAAIKQVATGQPYGEAAQQERALKAVPASNPNAGAAVPPVGGTGPAPPVALGQAPGSNLAAVMGQLRPIGGVPSKYPAQPVTSGLPSGPGPGPAPTFTPDPLVTTTAQLSQIPAVHQTPMMKALLAASAASAANATNPNLVQS